MGLLIIHGWYTECGECGYGKGGYMQSEEQRGGPPLSPSSRTCHGCDVEFTEAEDEYRYGLEPVRRKL